MRTEALPVDNRNLRLRFVVLRVDKKVELVSTLNSSSTNNLHVYRRPPLFKLTFPVLLERVGADDKRRENLLPLVVKFLERTNSLSGLAQSRLVGKQRTLSRSKILYARSLVGEQVGIAIIIVLNVAHCHRRVNTNCTFVRGPRTEVWTNLKVVFERRTKSKT